MRRRACDGCVCPGSFDPVTNGHLDVIERASALSTRSRSRYSINKTKAALFTVDERLEMLREATAHLGNVGVDSLHGLLVDYCRDHDIPAIVKGLRAVGDFDYELQMAQMNHGWRASRRCSSRRTRHTVPRRRAWSRRSRVRRRRVGARARTACNRQLIDGWPRSRPTRADRSTDANRRPPGDRTRGRARQARRAQPPSSRAPARCRCRRPASSTAARCWPCSTRCGPQLPEEFDEAERILRRARRRARPGAAPRPTEIVAEAHEERMRLVSQTEVYAQAQREAGRIRGEAARGGRPHAATRPTTTSTASSRASRSPSQDPRGRASRS